MISVIYRVEATPARRVNCYAATFLVLKAGTLPYCLRFDESGLDSESLPRLKYRLLFTPRKETSTMTRLRIRCSAPMTLVLAVAIIQTAKAQDAKVVSQSPL